MTTSIDGRAKTLRDISAPVAGCSARMDGRMSEIDPAQAGFSIERLDRLDARYRRGVEDGEIPGAVVLIMRGGKIVHHKAIGFADRAAGAPMSEETVFWLASMSKPITSVAALLLTEWGLLDLSAPVADYLPALAGLQLAVEKADGTCELKAPSRQPTVQDLLRHTSGMVYGDFGDGPVHRAYRKADPLAKKITSAQMIERLASLPLAHQPGSTFEYSLSVDVLGRIVEVISGQTLDRFLDEHIMRPLGMTSTAFHVPLAKSFAWQDNVQARDSLEQKLCQAPALLSGGGGLYGTAEDYGRFAQMLLSGGEFAGTRLLSPASVALMTSNHLPDGIEYPSAIVSMLSVIAPIPQIGQGFGLGVAVRTDPGLHPAPGNVGDFYWAGAGGTYFWVDPAENMLAVVMTAQPEYAVKVRYRQLARNLVYQALINSNGPKLHSGQRIQGNIVKATGEATARNVVLRP